MTPGPARPSAPAIRTFAWEHGEVAALDWGGSGRPLVLLHPNGFCAGLYEPVAARLAGGDARPIAIDLPGHGLSSTPDTRAGLSFRAMAAAVVSVLDGLGIDRAIGVGGSLGGGVAVLVDELRPGVWDRLVLAEAVAFPAAGPPAGAPNPMAEGARRRRRTFPNRASAVAAYARRPPLSELAPEALEAYVRWGTRDCDAGVELRCSPDVEATVFEVSGTPDGAPAAWSHLPSLRCPTTVLAGTRSFLPDMFGSQAAECGAELEMMNGGHFVLHEDTERGVELLRRHALGPLAPTDGARQAASRVAPDDRVGNETAEAAVETNHRTARP